MDFNIINYKVNKYSNDKNKHKNHIVHFYFIILNIYTENGLLKVIFKHNDSRYCKYFL